LGRRQPAIGAALQQAHRSFRIFLDFLPVQQQPCQMKIGDRVALCARQPEPVRRLLLAGGDAEPVEIRQSEMALRGR
jgi:hypothetical protein